MSTECIRCQRPMADQAYIDSPCAHRAVAQLAEIGTLTPAARDVAYGLTGRQNGSGGSRKPGSRSPGNDDALDALNAVQGEIQGWVRVAEGDRGPQAVTEGMEGQTHPDPLVWACLALTGQMEWLRHQPFADEALDAVEKCVRRMRGIVDGREPGRYAGPCSAENSEGVVCGEDVTARPGSNAARCRTCGAQYDVDEQQAWMRSEIEGYLARPVEISGVLLRLGFPIGYSTIAAYAAKGQIVAHGTDEEGRPLFRIGDVMTLRMGAKKS